MSDPAELQECRIVCIVSDPDTGKGYWCDTCPRRKPDTAAHRGRRWGKVYAQNREIRAAIDRGEHVHAVDVGKQRCWNGTRDCAVWSGQGDSDADRP